jgi:hypothetical protein
MRYTSAESNAKTTRPLEDRPGAHTRRARVRHSTAFSDRPPGPAGASDLQRPHCPQPQVAQSLVPLGLIRNAAPSALGRPARGAAGGGLPARHGFAAHWTRFRRKYHVPPRLYESRTSGFWAGTGSSHRIPVLRGPRASAAQVVRRSGKVFTRSDVPGVERAPPHLHTENTTSRAMLS